MTFKSTWVKAHQDDDTLPGQVLSDAALRNIHVGSIAARNREDGIVRDLEQAPGNNEYKDCLIY